MAVQPYSNSSMAKEHLQEITDQFRGMNQANSDAERLRTVALVILVATQIFSLLFFSLGVAYKVGELIIGACVLSVVGGSGSAMGFFFLKDAFMREEYDNQHLLALEKHIQRLPIENPET